MPAPPDKMRLAVWAVVATLSPLACGGKSGLAERSEAAGMEVPVDAESASPGAAGAAAETSGAGAAPGTAPASPSEPLPPVECVAPLSLPDPALQESFLASMLDEGLDAADFRALKTLGSSGVTTLSGIECLTGLENVYLDPGLVSDLTPLADLEGLIELHIASNPISDLEPLAGMTSLRRLLLVYGLLEDTGPLSGCTGLKWLWLMGNQIRDIGPLVDNPGLTSGDSVWLGENPLDCAGERQNIEALERRSVAIYTDC